MHYLRILLSGMIMLGMVGLAQAASDATTDKKSVALTPDKAADKKQKDIIDGRGVRADRRAGH